MSTFAGFSEEDLKRIKSTETSTKSVPQVNNANVKRIDKIGAKTKKITNQYKLPVLQKQSSDENIDSLFDKCKLSIKSPTLPPEDVTNNNETVSHEDVNKYEEDIDKIVNDIIEPQSLEENKNYSPTVMEVEDRKNSAPDILRSLDNYTEDELAMHREKLADLQLKQKIMEEQNKKRKEMLAKALADRTKQTAEEVMRLEKIKKELQVLDGQFSQDVSLLRKKIDHACLSYADAEKHYLRVEKEFLQAKINLQKEKEKKELLTEHLCALITHNETRKAQKLETLMLELASDKKIDVNDVSAINDEEKAVIVDGVDQRTGKMVELPNS